MTRCASSSISASYLLTCSLSSAASSGYIAPRQLCHSDNLQAIDLCALDTSIYEADRKAPIPQPICLIAFKRGIRLSSSLA